MEAKSLPGVQIGWFTFEIQLVGSCNCDKQIYLGDIDMRIERTCILWSVWIKKEVRGVEYTQ